MLCLGFSGGLNLVHENPYDLPNVFTHDGAAVIVEDGEVIAAVEEERLNRLKHSNKFPVQAIQFCLDRAGARLSEVDRIAFYATEEYANALLARLHLSRPDMARRLDARTVMHELLQRQSGEPLDVGRLSFVRHHRAHAMSAFAMSGFDRSLVLAIDGYGDFLSGLLAVGDEHGLTERLTYPQRKSLGVFYLEVIQFIGYTSFDEYKVMGLAPYGDPARYRDVLQRLYELGPDGDYDVRLDRVVPELLRCVEPRKRGQPFGDHHKDLAAALQEALERIVLHVLRHQRAVTGERRLCLAGGVAHNCTMNGHVLASGLFDDVFVQPAAHDAGCALGAALLAAEDAAVARRHRPLRHVYWGPDIGSDGKVSSVLDAWDGFVRVERPGDLARRTAQLLASGAVVGWVQGRSEFGPRALGNRSILADPRPAANKDRINAMVKKREGYRPFAPSVLEEDARDYFDVPGQVEALPFMIFVVPVREDKRALLGATTHVDGTARVHTVSRDTNPRYWELIKAFKDLTGVPVVLNTSFNNNAEPIVDSVEDAVVTFLTTDIDHLVVGDCLVTKRAVSWADRLSLDVWLRPYARLEQTKGFVAPDRVGVTCEARTTADRRLRWPISRRLYDVLVTLEAPTPLGELLARAGVPTEEYPDVVAELDELWAQRLVTLRPPARRPSRPAAAAAPSLAAVAATAPAEVVTHE
jgi:carbamoyltransferase